MNTGVSMRPSPEEAVRWLLLADPRIARTVGMNIFALVVPVKNVTLPFMAYSRQSIDRSGTLGSGPSRSSVVTLELNLYAATYDEARELAAAVREKIDGLDGQIYGLDIGGIQLTSESDDYVSLGGEQTASAYQVTMSFTVRWKETA